MGLRLALVFDDISMWTPAWIYILDNSCAYYKRKCLENFKLRIWSGDWAGEEHLLFLLRTSDAPPSQVCGSLYGLHMSKFLLILKSTNSPEYLHLFLSLLFSIWILEYELTTYLGWNIFLMPLLWLEFALINLQGVRMLWVAVCEVKPS